VQVVPERAPPSDLDRKSLTLDSGRELAWDKLLLACGARAKPAGVRGEAAGEVCYFRNCADLDRILGRVPAAGGTAVVLGGGLVGFKLTVGLVARGMRVLLLVSSPRPLSLNVDEYVGEWAAGRLAAHPDITLRTNTTVDRVDRAPDGRLALTTVAGERLEADLVAAGKGVEADIAWLAAAGLEARSGLLVDHRLRTSAPDVYAAGDCVQALDLVHGEPWINAVWPLAVEQGRVAAMNLAGFACSYPGGISMNAIPVFGSQMISVGAVNPRFTEGCARQVSRTRRGPT
jgi:NADPH-dependent 2,4-dienoyl-CoA reductase/sulfur reductase-like enzyme